VESALTKSTRALSPAVSPTVPSDTGGSNSQDRLDHAIALLEAVAASLSEVVDRRFPRQSRDVGKKTDELIAISVLREERVQTLEVELKRQQTEAAGLAEQIVFLRKEVTIKEQYAAWLRERIANLELAEKARSVLGSMTELLRRERDAADERANKALHEGQQLRHELARTIERLAQLETSARDAVRLGEELARTSAQLAQQDSELRALRQRTDDADALVVASQATADDLSHKLAEALARASAAEEIATARERLLAEANARLAMPRYLFADRVRERVKGVPILERVLRAWVRRARS
jgi:hypothetical protein